MFRVYEVGKDREGNDRKWFRKSLGDDKFTAEVLFNHMLAGHVNGTHSTDLVMVEEEQ